MDKSRRKKPGIKYAAALKYKEKENSAPRLISFGRGVLAEKIIAIARQNNIPLHQDPELACALSVLEIGREIPPELYQAIAEVLAFVIYVDRHFGILPMDKSRGF